MTEALTESPGETIRATIASMGLSVSAAADIMGVSQPYLNSVLHGRRGIGPVMALRLEALTGVSGEWWARLWAQYAVGRARTKRKAA